jgi:uncharacterized protein
VNCRRSEHEPDRDLEERNVTTLRSYEDVDDFLRGADLLAVGGCGDQRVASRLLHDDLDRGLKVGWSPLDLSTDGLYCTSCYCGSAAPESFEEQAKADSLAPGGRITRPLEAAVAELEDYLGVPITGVVPLETGGINAGGSIDAAANLGKILVDGDYAGRAIPELTTTTPHMFGVQVLPWACADVFGNRLIMRQAASDEFAERLGKFLALGSFGTIGCALVPLTATQVSEIYIPGTLTECLALGRAVRAAREQGNDPVQVAADTQDGWLLFRGTVTRRKWENTGYLEGTHEITGAGEFAGHTLKVWFKNENHVSWLDGKPYVTSPDLIEVCDGETAEPLSNTYLSEGANVAVIGRRRRDLYDSPRGLEVMGPRHFGFDLDFTPIESLT